MTTNTKTMLSALVHTTPSGPIASTLTTVPQPDPSALAPTQLIIRVTISGSNPKDWKIPVWVAALNNTNSGDDIAGIVTHVGSGVTEFRPGDRVASFHEMTTEFGSYAEYAVGWEHTTFLIPRGVSDEEAATIPLAGMTAAVGLYTRLGLPEPWDGDVVRRERCKGGVAVYGAASAVGAFVVKLLVKSGIHPIICVAGNGIDFVEGLIDREKGDTIVDYRKGEEEIVKGLRAGVRKGEKLRYAFDAVSEHGSYVHLGQVLEADVSSPSQLTLVLPGKEYEGVPEGINKSSTNVGSVHKPDNREFGYAWFRLVGLGLKEGWFSGHPYEVVEGGLGSVGDALRRLQEGKVSAKKLVFKIADTKGVAAAEGKL